MVAEGDHGPFSEEEIEESSSSEEDGPFQKVAPSQNPPTTFHNKDDEEMGDKEQDEDEPAAGINMEAGDRLYPPPAISDPSRPLPAGDEFDEDQNGPRPGNGKLNNQRAHVSTPAWIERKQMGFGDGTVWNALNNEGGGECIDWVVYEALTVFANALHSGEIDEVASDDDTGDDDDNHDNDAIISVPSLLSAPTIASELRHLSKESSEHAVVSVVQHPVAEATGVSDKTISTSHLAPGMPGTTTFTTTTTSTITSTILDGNDHPSSSCCIIL